MGGWLVVFKNCGLVIKETTVLPTKEHKKQHNINGPYCSTPGNRECLVHHIGNYSTVFIYNVWGFLQEVLAVSHIQEMTFYKQFTTLPCTQAVSGLLKPQKRGKSKKCH